MHPAPASMQSPSYARWSPEAVRARDPRATQTPQSLSHESRCFILADLHRAARFDNDVCYSCYARLSSEQREHVVEQSPDRTCKICDLKVSKPEAFTKPFCEFLAENPTIFHTVVHFKEKLNAVGFTEVR